MADLKTLGDEPETDVGPGTADPAPPSEPPAGVAAERTGRPRWGALMIALAAATLLLGALDAVLLVAGADPTARQRGPALEVARQVVLDLSRARPDDRDARLDDLRDATTGPLRDQLDGYAEMLRGVPNQGRTVDARIGASALEQVDATTAVALVAVTTAVRPDAPPVHHRLVVDLRRVDGEWKAEAVRFVP